MKKALIIVALIFSAGFLNAAPGRGGYLGHRIILNGEFSYSPFFTSVEDFFTKYNFQYGANLGVIVGRRSQLNVNYNMWQLNGNDRYSSGFAERDRVKGYGIGVDLRTFRKEKGGLAPIGKFIDLGLSYAQNKVVASSDNPEILAGTGENVVDLKSSQLLVHVGLGTQMVFWDRLVANTGIRAGTPIIELSGTTGSPYREFLVNRMRSKEIFSVFFGVGILL